MATIAPATRIGAQKTPSQTLRRVTVAGAMGNFVEWYDYGFYGLLATYLAASLVGGADPSGILLTNAGFLSASLRGPSAASCSASSAIGWAVVVCSRPRSC